MARKRHKTQNTAGDKWSKKGKRVTGKKEKKAGGKKCDKIMRGDITKRKRKKTTKGNQFVTNKRINTDRMYGHIQILPYRAMRIVAKSPH